MLLTGAFATSASAVTVATGGTGSTGAGGFTLLSGNAISDVGNAAYFNGATVPASDWVWDLVGGTVGNQIVFQFKFDLSGFDPNSAVLNGLWGVDNVGTADLNGTQLSSLPNAVVGNFNTLHALTAGPSSAAFLAGLNTLSFNVTDVGAPGAFRASVEITADRLSAVPLPAALPLFVTALAGLGFMSRRRKAA